MFLTEDELKTVSTVEVVNLITNNDDDTVENIIAECIALMKSYLYKYYDTDATFSAQGEARNLTLLRHLKILVLSDLYFLRKKQMPEGLEKKYDEAMRWLESVAKGNINVNLPPKLEDLDGDGEIDDERPFMRIGSRKSYKNHF